jgi:rod shape-determining protein MreD
MTRRMTTLKWVFYALWTLVFLLVQQLVFPYLRIAGVHPFILPSLAAIAASFEGKREGPVYALVLGLVCDTLFTGAFPCFYAVVLTLSALLAGQAARRLIMPGAVCSLAVSAGALLLTDLFNAVAFTYSHGTPPGEAMWLTAREILLSLPFAMLVHLVFSRVHRRFDRR